MTGSQLGLRRAERLVQRGRQQRAGVGSRPMRRRGGGRTEGSGRLSPPRRCRPRSWHTAPTWELELCRAAWRRAPWIGTVARQGAEPEPWGRGAVHAARPRRPVGARVVGVCVVCVCVVGVHVTGVRVVTVRVVAAPADPRAAGVLVGRLFFVPFGSGSEGGQEPWALSGTGEDEVLCR